MLKKEKLVNNSYSRKDIMTTKDLISNEHYIETYYAVHRLTKIACRRVGINKDDTEDLASDLLLLWEKTEAITITGDVEPFLRNAIKIAIHNYWEKKRNAPILISADKVLPEMEKVLNDRSWPKQTNIEIIFDDIPEHFFPPMLNGLAADCKQRRKDLFNDKEDFDNCGDIIKAIKYIKNCKLSFEDLMNTPTIKNLMNTATIEDSMNTINTKQAKRLKNEIVSIWENLKRAEIKILSDRDIAVIVLAIWYPDEMSEKMAADKLGVVPKTYKRRHDEFLRSFVKFQCILPEWKKLYEFENGKLVTERSFDNVEEVFCCMRKMKIELKSFLQEVIDGEASFPFDVSDFPKKDYK